MNCCISFAGIQLSFNNFVPNYLFNIWKWKLDPWKISNQLYALGKIEINRGETVYFDNKQFSLLYLEKAGFFERRIYRSVNGETRWDFVRTKGEELVLRYLVNATWDKISLLYDNTKTNGVIAFEYLAQIIPGVCLQKRLLTLHCALIEYAGTAVAICASSGTGKTTHARLWRDYKNALVLNGDRAVFRQTEDGLYAYGTPWSGTSGEQINRRAPLKALIVLERGKSNSISRLESSEAFKFVFPHLLYPSWERAMSEIVMNQLENVLYSIPVYRLKCKPDIEAVEIVEHAVWNGELCG